ncbi:hypothetical protein F8M41_020455 [Gigaspora margarita]|uniref:Uncharacterized protein n=1 Tax=Gigaspora margarita TaxID=4874 RepID=A0A8H4AIG8_GIGMA|nr:hypothetical protein F8M41_020455 [Gigaspora margarita]
MIMSYLALGSIAGCIILPTKPTNKEDISSSSSLSILINSLIFSADITTQIFKNWLNSSSKKFDFTVSLLLKSSIAVLSSFSISSNSGSRLALLSDMILLEGSLSFPLVVSCCMLF